MPAVVRFHDFCSGHGCWPSRPNDEASSDVFVNDLGVHRLGDHWITHCCVTCHDGTMASGSPNVFVNNKAVARVGDAISCGSIAVQGSPNVYVN
jgi:uncharacterized Zn-binding protein involved in type VI secretion